MALLISDKRGSKTKNITRTEERHSISIKGSIHKEDVTIINVFVPNSRASRYMKQKLTALKGETVNSIILLGH